jgi:hypothetical protein
MIVTVYGDCLRLGIKAQINLQELSVWLKKGIESALKNPSQEALEEAFDFISAYSDFFMRDTDGKGKRVLSSVLSSVQQTAVSFELTPEFGALFGESQLPANLLQAAI